MLLQNDLQHYYYIVASITVIIPAILILIEMFQNLNDVEGDNINYSIFKWTINRAFFIPFAWGVVMGHLFLGSMKPWIVNNTISVVIVAVMAALLGLFGEFKKTQTLGRSYMAVLIVLGAIVGHFLWSMNDYYV